MSGWPLDNSGQFPDVVNSRREKQTHSSQTQALRTIEFHNHLEVGRNKRSSPRATQGENICLEELAFGVGIPTREIGNFHQVTPNRNESRSCAPHARIP